MASPGGFLVAFQESKTINKLTRSTGTAVVQLSVTLIARVPHSRFQVLPLRHAPTVGQELVAPAMDTAISLQVLGEPYAKSFAVNRPK